MNAPPPYASQVNVPPHYDQFTFSSPQYNPSSQFNFPSQNNFIPQSNVPPYNPLQPTAPPQNQYNPPPGYPLNLQTQYNNVPPGYPLNTSYNNIPSPNNIPPQNIQFNNLPPPGYPVASAGRKCNLVL